ncbi:2'-5' RNA ligase family protein [Adhaeribacter radiodurans]|uniref:2'-5' RNA ligase family protein n=1 Tax=Adhaeribacter radiodurans TaxID=2745197 RepID=A0A7L7L6R3_9BACT|nr:2'-5' RNA ligase family protein [Adhaeribacter radiodurans]QMU28532.1 2'-5' RNA ligase family protein [Adhaeribacter radiodurans]
MMVAVVSLLDAEHSKIVNGIIDDLERIFGLRGVKITADPHITWLICEVEKLAQLKTYLSEAAGQTNSVRVKTTGLGIFPGEHPVVFVPVIRADGFNQVHAELYRGIRTFSRNTINFYDPDNWVPHISLALRDTTPKILPEIISYLNKRTYNWDIELNNFSILRSENNQFRQDTTYLFTSKPVVIN